MSAPNTASSRRSAQSARGDVLLMVGTTKGAFLFWSDAGRRRWRLDGGGPYFPGESVYAMAFDARAGRQRLFASTNGWPHGSVVRQSDDFGRTWSSTEDSKVGFPDDSGLKLKQIWQITPASERQPDVIYMGVEPACLFQSSDAGTTWTAVEGLVRHPHRPQWQPGGGGLCLHTIVLDPSDVRRILVAISTGGVYRSDDAGVTWRPSNAGLSAEFLPDNKFPEFGQCVHKIVSHPAQRGRLYLQNHGGVYRSDDWGLHWHDVGDPLPSDFGFALAVHPRDPATAFVIPMQSDMFHCAADAKLRVFRTSNGGASWVPLTRGLPQRQVYDTVVRDAFTTDSLGAYGLYFGTRNGKLFGSLDEGESWRSLAEDLPPITCVRVAAALRPVASSR